MVDIADCSGHFSRSVGGLPSSSSCSACLGLDTLGSWSHLGNGTNDLVLVLGRFQSAPHTTGLFPRVADSLGTTIGKTFRQYIIVPSFPALPIFTLPVVIRVEG